MILIALTGGIGAGKSTVSHALAARGAVVLDADAIVRDLQRPGRPVFDAMVERWGSGIVADGGNLDRQAVADIVFNDAAELEALETLIHPLVRREMSERIGELAGTDRVVVQDVPLLEKVMGDRRSAASVLVVDCPTDVAIERLVEHRGFDRAAAEARVAAQISREERLGMADFVIDNSRDLAALDGEIERCWQWIESLPPTPWSDPDGAEGPALTA
jgi:dephospho-CoA kinase